MFTIEEINLFCIYDTDTRESLLADLRVALPDVFDTELRGIVENSIRKLEGLTDAEYIELRHTLIPDEEYTGEDEQG